MLRVTGLVERESTLGIDDLATLPSVVENVGERVPGGVGRAVRLADVLELATPSATATHCTVISSDGYRASIPIGSAREGGWLAFGVGDLPLPEDDGGPLRLTVAEGSTQCWNVKAVGELHLAAGREPDDVPASPSH